MMLSLAPLKLLNVAQLALISRLLLNRNSAIDVPSSEGAVNRLGGKTGKPPTTPGTGNVLIFLGKHTIQLSPEQIATSPSSNRSSILVSPGKQTTTPVGSRAVVSNRRGQTSVNQGMVTVPLGRQVPSSSALSSASRQNRLAHQQSSLTRPSKHSSLAVPPQAGLRKISRSQETTPLTTKSPAASGDAGNGIFYLPYAMKQDQIQFFDFDRHFISRATNSRMGNGNSRNSNTAREEQSSERQEHQEEQQHPVVWPSLRNLLVGKSSAAQSPSGLEEPSTETDSTAGDFQPLLTSWFKHVFARQVQEGNDEGESESDQSNAGPSSRSP